MKFRRTNKVGKFEIKMVKNKGAVSKNVVRVAITPRSPEDEIIMELGQEDLKRAICRIVLLRCPERCLF